MKKIKNVLAVLMCLVMLFSFAACRNNDGTAQEGEEGTTGATQIYDNPQALENVGLSYEKLRAANKIESLMKKYKLITVKGESSSGDLYVCQVFRLDDSIALVKKSAGTVSGFAKGFDFAVENGRIKAYCDLENLQTGEDFDSDDMITQLFDGKKLVVVEAADNYYKLESLSEDKEKAGHRYFVFDKETLALKGVTYKNAVGNTEGVEISFDGELEDFAKKLADSFADKLKAVKVAGGIIGDGGVAQLDVKLMLPADWEYIPSGDGRIDYYMDEAMTEAYAYPGDGKDYAIYVSNVFDDEDTGKK